MGLLGLALIVATGYVCSTNRRAIKTRIVVWGIGLQFLFAFLILRTPIEKLFELASQAIGALLGYASEGSQFVFGSLGANGGPAGATFAFQVLPAVIFFAALFAVLYQLGLMQGFIRCMGLLMQRALGVSGAESTCVAANVFMDQTTAPLTIRPFLSGLTQSELFTIMTSGMAHVSGAVMTAYVILGHVDLKHLLTAVIITVPGALLLAKLFVPEDSKPQTMGSGKIDTKRPGINIIDAAARGAADGMILALMISTMLIAFVALIAMTNGLLGWVHHLPFCGWIPPTMQALFGRLCAPIAWVIGISWRDCSSVGSLMGTRLVLNEFVAFADLGAMRGQLDPRSFILATYALCGFANFTSIAVQIGGIGALVPGRRADLARLGLRAVAAGTLANFMSACIVGLLL